MAQPSGQVLVDSGHALAGTFFAYANDTGLWNATSGAMLSKTGTGAVVNEGGVNLATSDGTTWYTLASALTTSGDGTFTWRARKAAGATDSAGVVLGNHANVANTYVWMRTADVRMGGATLGTNASPTTLSTYSIVRTGGKGRFYKDGVFVNELASITQLSTLYVMNGLPASPTYRLNGAVEFFHAAIGKAFSDAEVAAFHADPYQILEAGASTADGSFVVARSVIAYSSATRTAARSVSEYVTATKSVAREISSSSGEIAITSPAPYRLRQRAVTPDTASLTIAGTSTATTIEYRRGTGAWQTLVASHPGGAYSATVTMPTGQGDLQVRHADDNAVTASVPLSTVGDSFILIGQSNNVGVSPEIVPPVPGAFVALQYDRADTWKPLQEGDTQVTSFDGGSTGSKGSYVGALSNRLQAQGIPVAFVPAAVGSTRIDQWERYAPLPTALSTLYGRALTQWQEMGGGRAAILWQGESDATAGTSKADYKARLHGVIDGWWMDTGTPTFLILITNFHANAPMIREAQMEVIAENPHVIGWADGGGAYSGDVHYLTATQINAVADAIYPKFVEAFYTAYASTTSTLARSLRGYASQSAALSRVVRGFAAASTATVRSLRNAVSSSKSLSRNSRVFSTASSLLQRSIEAVGSVNSASQFSRVVRNFVDATKPVVRAIESASTVHSTSQISRSIRNTVLRAFITVRSIDSAPTVVSSKTLSRQVYAYVQRSHVVSRRVGDAPESGKLDVARTVLKVGGNIKTTLNVDGRSYAVGGTRVKPITIR